MPSIFSVRHKPWVGSVLAGCLLAASGCKSGDRHRGVSGENDPTHKPMDAGAADSGTGDAMARADANATDGASPSGSDAGSTAAHPDAAHPDAAGPDPNQLNPSLSCDVAAENAELDLRTADGDESVFSLTTGLTGFGVAYHAPGCGEIGTVSVSGAAMLPMPTVLLDDCKVVRDMALIHVSDGYRLAWVDNASGSAELQGLHLSHAMTSDGTPVRSQITDNQLREMRPVFATVANVAMLAFIAADPATDRRQIQRKRFDAEGSLMTVLPDDSGHKPVSLAFAQLATENSAIAFVDEVGDRGVWLIKLDKTGSPVSAPVRVTDLVSAGNSVDLATRQEDGGAVLYSVDVNGNLEVRFRRLDRSGAFLGQELKVVGAPLQARDAGFTRIGGGYVVAYRQLPTPNMPQSEVRMTFISKEGNVNRDSAGRLISYRVADAAPNGGRITIRLSNDGQLLIGFMDALSGTPQLRLLRKRLDCTL